MGTYINRQQKMEGKKERESNIELLRLILMFMIVVHHGIVHGVGLFTFHPIWGGYFSFSSYNDCYLLGMINSFLIIAVNTFILISGYYKITSSWQKIASLLIPLFVYNSLFTIVPYIINHQYNEAISSLFFLSNGRYWFLTNYVFLSLFTPILNIAFENLRKREHLLFLLGLIVINCYFGFYRRGIVNIDGYCLMQFLLMYSIGRYLRIYNVQLSKWQSSLSYICFSLLSGLCFCLLLDLDNGQRAWRMTYYNNPLVIASSIAFFLFFTRITIHSKTVNWLASSALAIYLFSSTELVSGRFHNFIHNTYLSSQSVTGCLIVIVYVSLAICIVSILIDKVISLAISLFPKYTH